MTHYRRSQRGFTMIESIMAILIISVMYVAALNTVGASRVSEALIANQRKGHQLAQQLLSEIIALPYLDPTHGDETLGRDGTETAINRSAFDDIDDYHAWIEQPPQLKDGTQLTGLDEFSRAVRVTWIDPTDLDRAVSTDTQIKRITVTVSRRGKTIATFHALRAKLD